LKPEEAGKKALDAFEEDRKPHEKAVSEMERHYRAYRGVLEGGSEADTWNTKHHPPLAFQILETVVAGLTDPKPRWSLVPKARFTTPPEVADVRAAAAQLELLLASQRKSSSFMRDQRIHRLQALICRLTARKVSWDYQLRPYNDWESYEEPVYDDVGFEIGSVSKMRQITGQEVVKDDPKSEVVDVRHLIIPAHATSFESAPRVTHRLYLPFDEIKRRECKVNGGKHHEGPCEGGYYHDVDKLKDKERGSSASEAAKQAGELFSYAPHPDDIELLEHWSINEDGSKELTVLGNKEINLRHRESPYNHGKFPFIVSTGTPYPFRVHGISDVEQIMELQEMIWSFSSQRMDNVKLVNNAIVLLREDTDDPDAFEFYPGARNLVADPEQVQMWSPDIRVAEVSLSAEAMLKQEMESVSGGSQWLSGDQSMNSGGTATEASLLTTLAQRRVAAKRQFFLEADAEEGQHYIDLNDQFLHEERYLQIVGREGFEGWKLINPAVFREFAFQIEIEGADESMMREQRQASKQALYQTAVAAAPVHHAVGQPLNLKAFMDDMLDAHDVRDKERYYAAAPQPALEEQQSPSQAPAEPGTGAEGAGGITNPELAAGLLSPSSEESLSPVEPMQQMGAMSGPTQ